MAVRSYIPHFSRLNEESGPSVPMLIYLSLFWGFSLPSGPLDLDQEGGYSCCHYFLAVPCGSEK